MSEAKSSVNRIIVVSVSAGTGIAFGIFIWEMVERVLNNFGLECNVNDVTVSQNRRAQFSVEFSAAIQVYADDWKVQLLSRLNFPTNKLVKMPGVFPN
jgi:hypothetical protein